MQDEKRILVATAKTGMVCYDYAKKKLPLYQKKRGEICNRQSAIA